jgi:predicted nucleic acid-binding Zn ribbon protein
VPAELDRYRHRNRRLRVVRSATYCMTRMPKAEVDAMREELANVVEWHPKRRSDCVYGVRPCPYVTCKYNLYLDVTQAGNIKFNFPDIEPGEMVESCVLDIAEDGGATLERCAELLNMTRERVRQIQATALEKLSRDWNCVEAAK